ncbi:hypothetical protein K505DRAFT_404689 [Melanomma pulvis-pyrius CBS 109.77]|uniref:Uncharacterized protein n=1 Tax=Melanomma pulvis-pyrius CBS 109.77 TaxID=1314802 RepID=A0A6A6XTJ9_9PLEO|nr:hypothetical protein K505DRAFT_404689 [Melanomma pulvis-pyrius CBS 109.77]
MSTFSLEDFDKHIQDLRSQLAFLTCTLDATDHNAPDWLATDLIALRNKSGRLHDDMQRFRDQVESEGLGVKKASSKRLSLEGAKPKLSTSSSTYVADPSTSKDTPAPSSPPVQPPTPKQPNPENDYVVQHIDVTDEVNRRLQENRLRRLMDSPSTSQKRKYNADTRGLETGEGDEDLENEAAGFLDRERSPKKLRASLGFEERLKRKEGVARGEGDDKVDNQMSHKRRRM